MVREREVVITGVGVVCPLGLGRAAYWEAMLAQTSGVRRMQAFDPAGLPVQLAAEVLDFDPKQWVTPRKSLKVMSREIQIGFAAAEMAWQDAGLTAATLDADRFGVVLGSDMIYCEPQELQNAFNACISENRFRFELWGERALPEMNPLWLLKYLPNMPACHIAISRDARGPNNTITLGEVSSLVAMSEAVRNIERNKSDLMISGGVGSRVHPSSWAFQNESRLSHRIEDPARASRPFDSDRDGYVLGEGGAAYVLESREHAESRGAPILARVLSYGGAFEPRSPDKPVRGTAIRATIEQALRRAGLTAADIGHVNANGLSTVDDDRAEAQAIFALLGDIPVTAPKSFFGNLGAGTAAVEMAASVLAIGVGQVPVTMNYERPDPECPVNVIHGQPLTGAKPCALILSQAMMGQAASILIAAP